MLKASVDVLEPELDGQAVRKITQYDRAVRYNRSLVPPPINQPLGTPRPDLPESVAEPVIAWSPSGPKPEDRSGGPEPRRAAARIGAKPSDDNDIVLSVPAPFGVAATQVDAPTLRPSSRGRSDFQTTCEHTP